MTTKQTFAPLVWWRYVKTPQTLNVSVRTPKPLGLYNFLKLHTMNKKETAVIVDGKEINAQTYFGTLHPKEKNLFNVNLENNSFWELGCKIQSIIDVCILALRSEREEINPEQIICLLEMSSQIIPFKEFELLDKIYNL